MKFRASNILFSLFLLIPVIVYFRVLDFYAVNIPKWDDHALKMFLLEYISASTFSEKLAALVKQHNEHRIALTRLIAWIDYSVVGKLNYRHLMLAGNILLLGVPLVWWKVLAQNKKPFYVLLPLPFLWLTLAHWENMYWGMASIQNFGVVTLAVTSIYFLSRPSLAPFFLSIVAFIAAIATSGNGLILLPIGSALVFIIKDRKKQILWHLLCIPIAVLYFTNFSSPPYTPESKASIAELAKGYMAFLGSFAEAFPVGNHFGITIVMGCILFLVAISIAIASFLRLLRNRYPNKNEKSVDIFCLGVLVFILGTGAIVVFGRAGFGLEGLITSRYKIYSLLLVMTVYLYIVIPIRGSFLSPYVSGIVLLCISYNIFAYHYHLLDAYNLRRYLTTSNFNSNYIDRSLKPALDSSLAASLVEKPLFFYNSWLPLLPVASLQSFAGQTRGLTQLFEQTTIEADSSTKSIRIQNTTYDSQRLLDSGVYVVLSSHKRYYLFPTLRDRNTGRKQLFLRQQYFASGFQATIPFAEIDSGRYAVGLVSHQDDKTGIILKKDSVTVTAETLNKVITNW
jgi:hypothetical protein